MATRSSILHTESLPTAMKTVTDFILGGSKITADGDCSYEIKTRLLLGRKVMNNLDSLLKSRDITNKGPPISELCPVLSLVNKWTRLKHQPVPLNVTLDAAILSAMLNLPFTVTALVKYFSIKNECLCFDADSVL